MPLRKLIHFIVLLSISPFVSLAEGEYLCQTSTEKMIVDRNEYEYSNLSYGPSNSVARYRRDIRRYSVPSHDEMIRLFQEWKKTKKQEVYNEIVNRNLRLPFSIAEKYLGRSRGLSLSELISAGNEGLIKAVKKFNYCKGYRFSTYATPWIHQMITRLIGGHSNTIRIAEETIIAMGKMNKTTEQLRQKLGRKPSPEEIMEEMNMTLETFRELQKVPKSLSLETHIQHNKDSGRLIDLIEDKTIPAPDDAAITLVRSREIGSILSTATLTPNESTVLKMYFGFEGVSYTFQEIAVQLSYSRDTIRKYYNSALDKLRGHPQAELLQHHYRDLN